MLIPHHYLVSLLPSLLTGAMLILTLVLYKGDICPGQRGRIHKAFPVLSIGWLIACLGSWICLVPAVLLGYAFTQVKTSKTRISAPKLLLNLINIAGVISVVWVTQSASNFTVWLAALISVGLLGASLAHVLLVRARSRLEAFHRILPVSGIVFSMLLTLSAIPVIYGLDEQVLSQVRWDFIVYFLILVLAIVLWIMPILLSRKPNQYQLALVSMLLLFSNAGFVEIFSI